MQRPAARTLSLAGGVVSLLILFLAVPVWGQSLGEVARRERARQKQNPCPAPRVLTNEDLQREKILPVQSVACADAARIVPPVVPTAAGPAPDPGNEPVIPGDLTVDTHEWAPMSGGGTVPFIEATSDGPGLPDVPLGTIARYYRARHQARVEQQKAPPRTAVTAASFAPVVRASESVRVCRGDTLWKLAAEHLGSGLRWHELAELNPQISNPDLIYVGQTIRVRAAAVESAAINAQQFRVARGDTLWDVAESRYGNGLAWQCVAQANPALADANRIYPGQVLALPSACTATP